MSGLAVGLVLLVAPGWCRERALDETGTRGSESAVTEFKTLKKQVPAGAGSSQAERAGFEPAVGFYPHAALAKRCFRPLSHLSRWVKPFPLQPLLTRGQMAFAPPFPVETRHVTGNISLQR